MRDSRRLLSVSRAVSLPAKLIDSSIPAVTTPMMRTTTRISSSVKPAERDARMPAVCGAATRSVGEVPIANGIAAARLAVGAQRVKVIGLTVRAGILVLILAAPRVLGELLNIGAVPVGDRRIVRLRDERLEAIVRGWILRVVEAVFREGGLQSLDVGLGLGDSGLVDLVDDLRHDDGREQADDDHDDHDLDQGEASRRVAWPVPPPVAAAGPWMFSVRECGSRGGGSMVHHELRVSCGDGYALRRDA